MQRFVVPIFDQLLHQLETLVIRGDVVQNKNGLHGLRDSPRSIFGRIESKHERNLRTTARGWTLIVFKLRPAGLGLALIHSERFMPSGASPTLKDPHLGYYVKKV